MIDYKEVDARVSMTIKEFYRITSEAGSEAVKNSDTGVIKLLFKSLIKDYDKICQYAMERGSKPPIAEHLTNNLRIFNISLRAVDYNEDKNFIDWELILGDGAKQIEL